MKYEINWMERHKKNTLLLTVHTEVMEKIKAYNLFLLLKMELPWNIISKKKKKKKKEKNSSETTFSCSMSCWILWEV